LAVRLLVGRLPLLACSFVSPPFWMTLRPPRRDDWLSLLWITGLGTITGVNPAAGGSCPAGRKPGGPRDRLAPRTTPAPRWSPGGCTRWTGSPGAGTWARLPAALTHWLPHLPFLIADPL